MHKRIIFLVGLLASFAGFAQSPKMPELLPPTPEAASIIKAGLGNVSFSTGAVNAQVPIYTIKLKDYTFPINISYNSQGTKVDEPCSRVGLGWTLNAGGVVTRTVRGVPDELALKPDFPAVLGADTWENYDFCDVLAYNRNNKDAQRDEYSFNVNGISGKFVLDDSNRAVIQSYCNVKIQAFVGTKFIITNTDGVKYYFGDDAVEKTLDMNLESFQAYKRDLKTAFYLYRIELPTGQWIQFNYGHLSTQTNTGITQSETNLTYAQVSPCNDCIVGVRQLLTHVGVVQYITSFLTDIQTSDGLTATFAYENRPDLSGDNRLKTAVITGPNVPFYKKFLFDYYDLSVGGGPSPAGTGTLIFMGRYFLTKMVYQYPDDNFTDTAHLASREYLFNYEDKEHAATPVSMAQDYFGFANNNVGGNLLNLKPDGTEDISQREPSWTASIKGILKSIVYPTGGKEEFFYEPNTLAEVHKRNTFVLKDLRGTDDGPFGGSTSKTFTSSLTWVKRDQVAQLTLSSYQNPQYTGTYTPFDGEKTGEVKIYDNYGVYYQTYLTGYNSNTINLNLLGGRQYTIELTVKGGYQNGGYVGLYYDSSAMDIMDSVNAEFPGVRLKQIAYTDLSGTRGTYNKYFKYASFANINRSSGYGNRVGGYSTPLPKKIRCPLPPDVGVLPDAHAEYDCPLTLYSSSTAPEMFAFDGSHVYYQYIIESDDSTFVHGGTEYEYYAPDESPYIQNLVRGTLLPSYSGETIATKRGLLHATRVYNNNRQLQKEQVNNYEALFVSSNTATSTYVRQRYVPPYTTTPSISMVSFDIMTATYTSRWIRLSSLVENTWENGQLMSKTTTYTYGNKSNIQPVVVASKDSKNNAKSISNTYPTDYLTDNVMALLVNKNMISQPIQTTQLLNSNELSKVVYKYRDWQGDGSLVLPDTVQAKQSPADVLHDAILFNRYDANGNILEVQKKDDLPLTYLWNYNNTYVVAEIQNATRAQVAYTSFETTDNGNWLISNGAVDNGVAGFTGYRCFSGTITCNLTVGGDYLVTLWSKSLPTANGVAGTATNTANGWTLYEWKLTNPASVSVSGTNIDEVRLRPLKSNMTSYTYLPFVGVTSKADNTNQIVKYEYNGANELKLIRDKDNNILKTFNYNYRGLPCSSYAQVLVPTGATRCVKDEYNNNTGAQEQEMVDDNICSATYLSKVWVSAGVSVACSPIVGCSVEGKKVINGVCTAGVKVYTDAIPMGSMWRCIYHYEFPDGSWSRVYDVTGPDMCIGDPL